MMVDDVEEDNESDNAAFEEQKSGGESVGQENQGSQRRFEM